MTTATIIILGHQLVFQGLFFTKTILLGRKLGQPVRGRNPEARWSTAFFVAFILTSILLSSSDEPWATAHILSRPAELTVALVLLALNLAVGAAALFGLRDSWRVGVVEGQSSELIEGGVYRFSRNPFFLSYLVMFAAYTVLLQNAALLGLSLVGFAMVHWMILREERHLTASHGDKYRQYAAKVPRYLFF